MSSWGTILIASLIGFAYGIPCSDIGWSTFIKLDTDDFDRGHVAEYLNPLEPHPDLWDIVKAEDCWVRFQVPMADDRNRGRVTKTVFTATPEQIVHTMNNYFGSPSNIMLWLKLGSNAFQYANVMKLSEAGGIQVTQGQRSLDVEQTVMSVILPSGAEKLTEVSPTQGQCSREDMPNVIRAQSAGITGLRGTISPEDWAYSTGKEARLSIHELEFRQSEAPKSEALSVPGWMLATKADGNCVVIDLTGIVDFAAYKSSA